MGTRLGKTYTTVILLLPLLSQYESGIPKLSLGDLALLLAVGAALLYSLRRRCMPKINVRSTTASPFLWFAAYIVCGSMLSSTTQYHVSMPDLIGSSIRFVFYLFCACVMSAMFFDLDYFIRKYRGLVIFATALMVVQTLLFYWKGYVLFGTIPGLKVSNPGYDQDVERRTFASFYRPGSMFLEPSYYAQFVFPYLAYTLFSKNRRQKYLKAMVPTIGCVLSTSGQGIIISSMLWAARFVDNTLRLKKRSINLRTVLVLILALLSVLAMAKTPMLQTSLQRLFGDPYGGSAASRIYRGYAIYQRLKPIHKIIGVGYGHVRVYLSTEDIRTEYSMGEDTYSEYMNSIADILVSLGVIGVGLFSWMMIRLWRSTSGFRRACTLTLLLLSAVSAYFTGPGAVMYLSVIMHGCPNCNRALIAGRTYKGSTGSDAD